MAHRRHSRDVEDPLLQHYDKSYSNSITGVDSGKHGEWHSTQPLGLADRIRAWDWRLILCCIGAILGQVSMAVLLKKSANHMPSFPLFIFWFSSVGFALIFFMILGCLYFFTNWITDETTGEGQGKYVVIGLLTWLNGLLMLFANPHVPGSMQALLGPTVVAIPVAMVASWYLLGRRYNWKQIACVFLILAGLFVAIYPSLRNSSGGGKGDASGDPLWNMVFALGSMPVVFQMIYQERFFHTEDINIVYLLAFSSFWQSLAAMASFPVDAIPGFGTSANISDVWARQMDAFRCLFAESPTVPHCPECLCDSAAIVLGCFIVSYVTANLCLAGVVKFGNATFTFINAAVSLPMTEFAFSIRFIMGDFTESPTPYSYGALAILTVSVVLYRYLDTKSKAQASLQVTNESDGSGGGRHGPGIQGDQDRDELTMNTIPIK